MEIAASAPGKLFVLGEYAVTAGEPAIVCATERRLECRIRKSAGAGRLRIRLSNGDTFDCPDNLSSVDDVPRPFRFAVAAAAVGRRTAALHGIDLEILPGDTLDQGSPKVGLGGSAAVTAAILAGLAAIPGAEVLRDPLRRSQLGIQAHRLAQRGGSGADVAASTIGGLVWVAGVGTATAPGTISEACETNAPSLKVEPLQLPPDTHLMAIATGRAARSGPRATRFREGLHGRGPLGDAGAQALQAWTLAMSEAAASFRNACNKADSLVAQAAVARGGILFRRLPALSGLPVWSPELRRLQAAGRQEPRMAIKPSGAGGGDCAIALIRAPEPAFWQKNPVIQAQQTVELTTNGAGACAQRKTEL